MFTPRTRRRARALAWRLRFVTAALCCGAAATLAVHAVRPPPAPTTPVVVAARALDAGAVLAERDLRVARLPVHLVPDGCATRVAELTGRTTAVGVTAGLPLVGTLTGGATAASAAPPGTVIAPVRLDPAVAVLLSPGDRVDLLVSVPVSSPTAPDAAEPGQETEGQAAEDPTSTGPYLARSALVVPSPDPPSGGSWGTADVSGIVLVAVTPQEAESIASRTGWEEMTAVLVP